MPLPVHRRFTICCCCCPAPPAKRGGKFKSALLRRFAGSRPRLITRASCCAGVFNSRASFRGRPLHHTPATGRANFHGRQVRQRRQLLAPAAGCPENRSASWVCRIPRRRSSPPSPPPRCPLARSPPPAGRPRARQSGSPASLAASRKIEFFTTCTSAPLTRRRRAAR
jgi:hypothetical protein